MLGILLTVLKVIGIALLILLALLLLIILIVLFVPVRYSAKGSYLKKIPKAYIKVTYLLYILYIKLLYDKKPDLTVRIFGIKLNLKKIKKKKNVKVQDKPKEDNKKASDKEESSTKPVSADSGKIEAEGSAESEVHTSEDDTSSKPSKEDSKNKKKEASKENKESEETEKISLSEKISKKKEDIEAIIDLLTSDSAKRAFFVSKKRIAKAIGSILPHKGHIYAKIGLSNAGTTGKILGIYKALYDYVGNTVTFIPVFDEEIIEVEFDLKGKIRAATVLYHLICIYMDKDCRKIIKTIIRKVKKKG